MNPKEKMACDARTKRKIELRAEQDELRVADEAVIAMEEKRKLDAAKQRFETVFVEILGPDGHVGRCTIPIAVVVQLGLFNILLGRTVENVQEKNITTTFNATQDMNIMDAPEPRPDQLPLGALRNTWPNIVNNKRSNIFCGGSLKTGEDCIKDFTAGSLLQ